MADNFRQVIEVALEATTDPNLRALLTQLRDLGDSGELTNEQLGGLGDQLKALSSELQGLGNVAGQARTFDELTKSLAETEERLDEASKVALALKLQLGSVAEPTREMQRAFNDANKEVQRLEELQRAQARSLSELDTELQAAGVNTQDLAGEQKRLADESERTTAAIESLVVSSRAAAAASNATAAANAKNANAMRELGDAVDKARTRVSDIATKLAAAGAAATAAAAAFAAYKTGEFFVDSVRDAAEFEAQISSIAAVSGTTGAALDRLKAVAKQAALDTGLSFSAVNETLGELARAVGDAEVAAKALGPTLDLATAGGLQTAKAAEILTTSITQFGLEADQATRIADLLANAANTTTTNVEQMGNALSYAAPLARQLGLSVEQTVAAIGALADEGFRGERAGTALRNVLSALSDPSSRFSAELSKLGIETRNFGEVMMRLAAAGDQGKRALLAIDAEARPAILALVNSGASGITRLIDSFGRMEVTAASAASVMRDNLQGAAGVAARAFESLRQELVAPLLQPLSDELRGAAVAMRAFAESPEFARIKDALKTLFSDGVQGAREFAAAVDWAALADQIAVFAESASERLATFADDAQDGFALAVEAANALGIAVDALQTGLLGLGALASKGSQLTLELAAAQAELLALSPAVRLVSAALGKDLGGAIEELKAKGDGLGAVFDEFGRRAADNANQTAAGMARVGSALDGAAGKADVLAEATQGASAGLAAVGQTSKGTGVEITENLQPGVDAAQRLEQAFALLKVRSQAELDAASAAASSAFSTIVEASRSGSASLQDARAAFEAYARTAIAAAATSGEATLKQVEDQLRATGAAIGAIDALERLGLATAQKIQDTASATSALAGGLSDVSAQAANAAQAIAATTEESQRASGGAGQVILAYLESLGAQFAAVSENARALFVETQIGLTRTATTLGEYLRGTEAAAVSTQRLIDEQRAALDDSAAGISRLVDASTRGFDNLGRAISNSALDLQALERAASLSADQFDLLSDADLSRLQAQIDRAASRLQALKDQAAGARDELEGLADSLQDALDQRAGNDEAVLRRRHEEHLERIRELAETGGAAAAAEAARARGLAQQNFEAELARIREQAAARVAAERDADERIADSRSNRSGSSGTPAPPAPRPPSEADRGAAPGPRVPTTVNLEFNVNGLLVGASRDQLTEAFLREIIPQLRRLLDLGVR